ncbi:MAG: tRNA pseudouridine synthase A, partial [Candidatus Woesearchaeota archaeon]
HIKVNEKIPVKKIAMAINRFLPKEISVFKARLVDDKFHARHDSKAKIYRYKIYIDKFENPFLEHNHLRLINKPNLRRMKKAARIIKGKKDFKCFMNQNSDIKNTVRNLSDIKIYKKNPNLIYIDFKADGFLYNMVRIIVGVLLDIGFHKKSISQLKEIQRTNNRPVDSKVSDAKGLTLIKTLY